MRWCDTSSNTEIEAMKTSQNSTRLVMPVLLMLWGAVFIYLYSAGRLPTFLSEKGWFMPMVLGAGIALVILGLFNLVTSSTPDAGCGCHGHDHAHDQDHKKVEGAAGGGQGIIEE